jgi:hypothetical protein
MHVSAPQNLCATDRLQARGNGHDVSWGCEFDQGASDVLRTALAAPEAPVTLTEDTDFAAIVFRDVLPVVGLVLIELHGFGFGCDARAARIVDGMREIGDKAVGKVHGVEPADTRSRNLP